MVTSLPLRTFVLRFWLSTKSENRLSHTLRTSRRPTSEILEREEDDEDEEEVLSHIDEFGGVI